MEQRKYIKPKDPSYLIHSGIKGMKWGERRFQNEDGTLTEEGRKRYGVHSDKEEKKLNKLAAKYDKQMGKLEKNSQEAYDYYSKKKLNQWKKAKRI